MRSYAVISIAIVVLVLLALRCGKQTTTGSCGTLSSLSSGDRDQYDCHESCSLSHTYCGKSTLEKAFGGDPLFGVAKHCLRPQTSQVVPAVRQGIHTCLHLQDLPIWHDVHWPSLRSVLQVYLQQKPKYVPPAVGNKRHFAYIQVTASHTDVRMIIFAATLPRWK